MSEGRTIRVDGRVHQPFELVRAALLADAKGIFSRASGVASERTEHASSALRVKLAGLEIGKEIQIEMLGSFDLDRPNPSCPRETHIELRWSAIGKPALFPILNGELVVQPSGAAETRLELSGNYEPPWGAFGTVLDIVVGRRIAEASVRHLMQDVAAQLEQELAKQR
ncbi:MAG TPA: hypothetical protein VG963_11250 [Polyangiaceae bacterium]|nr:hypothetical protein [Polyangiaceae bacterium]